MLHTSFRKLHAEGACVPRYKLLATKLGGIRKYGRDTPIPLSYILDEMGLADALWSLRATIEQAEKEKRLYACDCAERVLSVVEARYPKDTRLRTAIQVARRFALGEATREELEVAARAAGAAWAAAGAAAWDAEREWQTSHFREVFCREE